MIFLQLQRLIAAGIVVLVAALLLRWLWDITMPQLFHLPKASYWQVVRLLLILGIAAETVLLIVAQLTSLGPLL